MDLILQSVKFDTAVNILHVWDCLKYRSLAVNATSDSMVQKSPQSSSRQCSGGSSVQIVFGFPVDQNQFNVLQNNQTAESQKSTEREEGLVDPRTTRLQRLAAQRTEDTRDQAVEELTTTVPTLSTAQGIFDSDYCVEPDAVRNCSQFFPYSFPACSPDILSLQSDGNVQYMLESGAGVNVGGELYSDYCGAFRHPAGSFSGSPERTRRHPHGRPEFCKQMN